MLKCKQQQRSGCQSLFAEEERDKAQHKQHLLTKANRMTHLEPDLDAEVFSMFSTSKFHSRYSHLNWADKTLSALARLVSRSTNPDGTEHRAERLHFLAFRHLRHALTPV